MAIAQPALQVSFTADAIDYDRASGVVRASGNVTIRQGNISITSPRGSYHNVNGQSILTEGAVLVMGSTRWEASQIAGNHRDRMFLLEGEVNYAPSATVELSATAAIVNGNETLVQLSGPVRLQHPQWQAIADRAEVTPAAIVLTDALLTSPMLPELSPTLEPLLPAGSETDSQAVASNSVVDEETGDRAYSRIELNPNTGIAQFFE